jgi:5S rRNA maturation endonuclease (ribonuclease M5)
MDKFKTLQEFLALFPVQPRTKTSTGVNVVCPSHDDHDPSLSISETDSKILLHCQAGCKTSAILASIGLSETDLFLDGILTKPIVKIKHVADYIYQDEQGKPLYKIERLIPKSFKAWIPDFNNPNGWLSGQGVMTGVKRVLYHLPEVLQGIMAGQTIYICAGEKDADRLRLSGIDGKHLIATTNGFGETPGKWLPEYSESLKGANCIILTDPDPTGEAHVKEASRSLYGKAKSIKILSPLESKGKFYDLSDWLDKGELITRFVEIVGQTPFYEPESVPDKIEGTDAKPETGKTDNPAIEKTNSGYKFTWSDLNLEIRIERLTNDATGIIKVLDSGSVVHTSNINLLATRSISELSNKLFKRHKADWDKILSYIVNYCVTALEDTGTIENIDTPPVTMKVEYLLDPILAKNEPTTIFTAGGRGKSILADYLAVLVQNGLCSSGGLPFIACQANVLYLDWEADPETHRRYITAIKRGLNLKESKTIQYLKLDHPLSKVIDKVKAVIQEKDIGLVIIDSQMAATASGTQGLSEAQIASEYYNNIRSFGCSTLTIDHITKQGMTSEKGSEAPYGSVVKYNRSRSQFELRLPDEDENSDHKEFALVHRKYNLGRKQDPLGIAVDFVNNDNELLKITFASCGIKENPSFSKVIGLKDRIDFLLKNEGLKTEKEIADALGEPENTVHMVLYRYKGKLFTKVDKTWGQIVR